MCHKKEYSLFLCLSTCVSSGRVRKQGHCTKRQIVWCPTRRTAGHKVPSLPRCQLYEPFVLVYLIIRLCRDPKARLLTMAYTTCPKCNYRFRVPKWRVILGLSHPHGSNRWLRRLFPVGNWLIDIMVLLKCPSCGAIRWMSVSNGKEETLLSKAVATFLTTIVFLQASIIVILLLLIFASL